MADISKVFLDGVSYDVKDATARTQLGNKADNVPTLTQASTRENIANGDTVPEALGKVMKYFDDLGDLAFEDSLDASDVGAVATTEKGVANGVAELDSTGRVPSAQLPSFVDNVLEYDSLSEFPATGETGKIYVAKDTNKTYRWSGSTYVEISESLALGNTSSTAYRGDYGEAAYLHSQSAHARADATKTESSATNGNIKINGVETTVYTHPGSGTNPHGTTKVDLGLENVGNYKAVSVEANQNLTDTEKQNAKDNLGIQDTDTTYTLSVGTGGDANKIILTPSVGTPDKVTVPYASNAGTVNSHSVLTDGTYAVFTDTTYDPATQSADGLMSATDKIKVDALGTAATKDVATTGDASSTQVVMGNDSRLTDARNAADVYDWAKAATKPSYTASEVGAIATTAKGANNGVAELDSTGKVPSSQLPSYVDNVLEYDDLASFPVTGESGKIYVAKDTNKTYRWSGTAYVEISESLALGETDSTAYRGDKGKTAYDHSQITSGNPHNVTKADVGLDNVGNSKAVSTVANQGLSSTEQANARANIGIDDNFGGHEIIDGSGTSMTQRSKMQFVGATLEVTDDSTNGKTVITSTAEKEFTGTEQQWEALTTAQKKTYDKVSLIDDYVDPSHPDADDIAYDNTTSGLEATDVQSSIDELKEIIDSNPGTTYSLSVGMGADANKIVLTPSEGEADKITVPYATSAGDANTVNGKTVAINVPADAKFTDTNTWRGIQDNLTSSTNTTESLSAKQGYLLANGSARDNTKLATEDVGYKCIKAVRSTSMSTSTPGYWAAMVNSTQPGSPTLPTANQWWHVISLDWSGSDTANWISQLAISTQENNGVWYRKNNGGGTDISSSTWIQLAEKSDISTLQSNFQAGVDACYNACVAKGSTPASKSLSNVVNGIRNIPNSNSGTYTYGSGSTGGTVNLGANNTYRYVNATNVYNKGKADYTAPYYKAVTWYGDKTVQRTTSVTVTQAGTYYIFVTAWNTENVSNNWTFKQGSTTVYSGTDAWYEGTRSVSANTTLSLTAYGAGHIIIAFRVSS